MSESLNATELLETLAKVLLRCTGLGFLLLLLTAGIYMLSRNLIYELHGNMFSLAKHEIDVIMYCAMGLIKLFVLVFFFFPWLSIKLVLKNA